MGVLNWTFGLMEALEQQKNRLDHPGALSDLNTPVGNSHYWTTERGSILSVLRVEGSRELVMEDNHEAHIDELVRTLRSHFLEGTTDICWLHMHKDEEASNVQALERCLASIRAVSEIQGYKNKLFIDETVDVMKNHIQQEYTLLCVWTQRAEAVPVRSDIPFLKAPGTQGTDGLQTAERLLPSHKAKMSMILEAFKSAGIHARLMTNQEIGHHVASSLDPEGNEKFVPRLMGHLKQGRELVEEGSNLSTKQGQRFFLNEPGDPAKGIKGKDYTCIFPPKLGYQVWTTKPEYHKDYVVVGNRAFASLMVTLLPDEPISFEVLVDRMKKQRVPFRIAMHSKGYSNSSLMGKYVLSMFLKKVPGNNSMLYESIKQVRQHVKNRMPAISLQITVTVWAPRDDIPLLRDRIQQAQKSLNSWGSAQAKLMSDDSIFGLVSTLAPYSSRSVAPASVGPAEDVLYLAPITRPALPWEEGGVILRSRTGKLMPFQPLSDELSHHVYLVSGEPGYGKSLLCQVILIAICETHDVLPYVAITDVGPSSLGTIRYLQSILPIHRKHQVFYCEMRNEKRMSINRFDTPLGARRPLSEDFVTIRDWVLLGVSDSQTGETKDGMDALVADAINLAYDRCMDHGPRAEPKRHDEDNEVDPYWGTVIQPALDRHEIQVTRDTVYWKLVDLLFEKEEYHAAALVQRFAVPLLTDVISACNANEVRSAHRYELSPGFTMAEYAHQRLTALQGEMLITHMPTQFDLAEVRVSAFNLEGVVQNSNSVSAKRAGGLFFGLTSALQVEPFFWDAERVREIPQAYRAYHRARVDEVKRTKNVYFADEQHYFTGIEVANRIPDNIAALGRKRGIGVMLATQMPRSFTQLMRELSTIRMYVGFERSSIQNVVETMGLNENEQYMLEKYVRKPGSQGGHFLMQVDGEAGTYSQVCNLRVGIRKLWGLSTKNTSSEVRDAVTAEFGYEEGLEVLARVFPSGEAESEYERLRVQISDSSVGETGLERVGEHHQITDIVQYMIEKTKSRGSEILQRRYQEVVNG